MEIPYGYCHCGCGQKTNLINRNDPARGLVKGEPRRFVSGHCNRGKVGPKNSHWKGGKMKSGEGGKYISVYCPNHPNAVDGHVLEHIIAMEKKIGGFLPKGSVVHHRDHNPKNNSPENLILFNNQSEHALFHISEKAFLECGHYDYRKCWICHQYDSQNNLVFRKNSQSFYHRNCLKQYRNIHNKRNQ